MSVAASIREKLLDALAPERLEVVNESHLQAGHRSSPGTGEIHLRVLAVSAAFALHGRQRSPPTSQSSRWMSALSRSGRTHRDRRRALTLHGRMRATY